MKSNVNAAMDKAQEILKSESNEEADVKYYQIFKTRN